MVTPRNMENDEACAALGCRECNAIVDERRDGPRYVAAIRGARAMRHESYERGVSGYAFSWNFPAAYETERQDGIPEGWITRE